MKNINKLINNTTKMLYDIKLYNNNHKLANYNFIVSDKKAVINNIQVHKKNMGIGSYILKNIENHVKEKHNVNNISLLAWQNSENEKVVDFYKKNGYRMTGENSQIYDDSVIIYDLYKFEKNI
jgi:ribosomal protein S18 acetylase RimI-like enzyme